MAGFSRINPDVIDLGTTQLSGVTVKLSASARSPYDGTWTNTNWTDATNYFVGNAVVYDGEIYNAVQIHLSSAGVNDPGSDTYDPQGIGTFWKKVDGKDGDVWMKASGASSSVFQKANGAWINITPNFSGAGVILNDSAVGDVAFSQIASSYRTAIVDYYITSPGGNFERGQMNIVNDGVDAYGTVYNIQRIGTNLQIDFLFEVNGSNLEVKYNSSATPTSRTLFYIIRR